MKIHTVKISKKNATFYLLILFLMICLIFIFLCIKAGKAAASEAMKPMPDPSLFIILDAGHGGEDGGAVTADGSLEKDINLEITLILNDLLKLSGYETILVRDQDEDLADKSLSTVRERKVSDLQNRSELVNKTEQAILVSIHQNYFDQTQYSGAQIFYSVNHEKGKILGEAIREKIIQNTQPENTRELKPADKGIYLLKHVSCPAVIVECGFLSNPEEAQKLCTPAYRQQIAFSIYEGICTYLKDH